MRILSHTFSKGVPNFRYLSHKVNTGTSDLASSSNSGMGTLKHCYTCVTSAVDIMRPGFSTTSSSSKLIVRECRVHRMVSPVATAHVPHHITHLAHGMTPMHVRCVLLVTHKVLLQHCPFNSKGLQPLLPSLSGRFIIFHLHTLHIHLISVGCDLPFGLSPGGGSVRDVNSRSHSDHCRPGYILDGTRTVIRWSSGWTLH